MFQKSPEPLELVPLRTGPLQEFFVKIGSEEMFLRVIALWTDNTALGGAAPTFQLKAPGGIITSVNAGAGDVEIPGEGGRAATANCERLQGDVFLVTIANINEDVTNRNWQLRIKNNADQTLRFVWISADRERRTRQPWLVLPSSLSLAGSTPIHFIPVRNWGTAPVTIDDAPDTLIGGRGSPVTLVSRPVQVAPHGVDHIVVRCAPVAVPQELRHTFTSNDPDSTHATLPIRIS